MGEFVELDERPEQADVEGCVKLEAGQSAGQLELVGDLAELPDDAERAAPAVLELVAVGGGQAQVLGG